MSVPEYASELIEVSVTRCTTFLVSPFHSRRRTQRKTVPRLSTYRCDLQGGAVAGPGTYAVQCRAG